MKILKIKNDVTVFLDNGTSITVPDMKDEVFEALLTVTTEEQVKELLFPKIKEDNDIQEGVEKSDFIKMKSDGSATIPFISDLTLPKGFALKFFQAEKEKNKFLIESYLNFWTLLSQNPNSQVRNNLFWFMDHWGMNITHSGLLICYRNVDIKSLGSFFTPKLIKFVCASYTERINSKQDTNIYVLLNDFKGEPYYFLKENADPEDDNIVGILGELYQRMSMDVSSTNTVFTDVHSHSFNIRIGQTVMMPRKEVDSDSSIACSRGLHCGAKGWLKQSYYGSIGLRVLLNPRDVCAVPPLDDYGKIRTCAYFPIGLIDFDSNGNVLDTVVEQEFEDKFFCTVSYACKVNNVDFGNFKILIKSDVNCAQNREQIYKELVEKFKKLEH